MLLCVVLRLLFEGGSILKCFTDQHTSVDQTLPSLEGGAGYVRLVLAPCVCLCLLYTWEEHNYNNTFHKNDRNRFTVIIEL